VTSKPLFALLALVAAFLQQPTSRADATLRPFLETHCIECHDGEDKKGGLDLASLREIHADPKTSAQWIKVFDRVLAGEMPPPKKKAAPQADSK